jgi:uncharacterized protein (TIGR02421 family)
MGRTNAAPTSLGSKVIDLDHALVRAAKKIRVLGALSFSEDAAESFLTSWHAKNPRPPELPAIAPVPAPVVEVLEAVHRAADAQDPLGRFVQQTAASYLAAAALLGCPGTAAFHALSRQIYGSPDDPLPGSDASHLEAADRLLEVTAALTEATREHDLDYTLTAEHVADQIRRRIRPFFTEDRVRVVIDPNLSAKAAASARRIRLRGRASFSPSDIDQLVEHEAFVHSATALNGRKQPQLSCLSLGAPRTTGTQEGLATFAELITGSIDLARLRRLALRIRAVHLAAEGADFTQVFEYFLSAGQSESESVHSTLRIFRGAHLGGRYPFTKDVVYLRGLFAVHTFMRKAIGELKPGLIARLFVGRLTVGDVLSFEESFAAGHIARARYIPLWAKRTRSLAAYLAFSTLLNRINLSELSLAELDG